MTFREALIGGLGYMLGACAGVLAVLLAVGQIGGPARSPEPVRSVKAWHMIELNRSRVPLFGSLDGGRLTWDVADQRFEYTPYLNGPAPARTVLRPYTIRINGADAVVKGWHDKDKAFRWAWDDQAVALLDEAPAAVNPMGARANGVVAARLDGSGTIRASDPATAAEVRAVMEAQAPGESSAPCKPDREPDERIKPPDIPGAAGPLGLDWWVIAVVCGVLVLVMGTPMFLVVLAIVAIAVRWAAGKLWRSNAT